MSAGKNEHKCESEKEVCCQASVSRPINQDLTRQVSKRVDLPCWKNGYSCDQDSVIVKRVPTIGGTYPVLFCKAFHNPAWSGSQDEYTYIADTHIFQRDPIELDQMALQFLEMVTSMNQVWKCNIFRGNVLPFISLWILELLSLSRTY